MRSATVCHELWKTALQKRDTGFVAEQDECQTRSTLCMVLARLYGSQGKTAAALQAQREAVAAANRAVRVLQIQYEFGTCEGERVCAGQALQLRAELGLRFLTRQIIRHGLEKEAEKSLPEWLPIPIPTSSTSLRHDDDRFKRPPPAPATRPALPPQPIESKTR